MAEPPKKPKGRPGPKPDPTRVRDATTMVRSSAAWKAFLEQLAEYDRATSVSELIDRAVIRYAREIGFKGEMPKR